MAIYSRGEGTRGPSPSGPTGSEGPTGPTDSEGPRDPRYNGDDNLNGDDQLLEEESSIRRLLSGSSDSDITPFNTDLFYNTVSCPCSTYVIKDSNNNIGCEREYYGVKQYFKPAIRNSHFIEDDLPRLGDKWECRDKTCEQSGYDFDGYYVVEANLNKTQASTSVVNSRRYTQNCFVPKSVQFSDYTLSPSKEVLDLIKEHTVTTINDIPIFDDIPTLILYSQTHEIDPWKNGMWYDGNGIKGFAPTDLNTREKRITGCYFGNRNLLSSTIHGAWGQELSNTSHKGKKIVKAIGETVIIRINGLNNPMFTLTIKDSDGQSILNKKIENVSLSESGEYLLYQDFPAIGGDKTHEIYDLTIIPSADTKYYYRDARYESNTINAKIYQFKVPTLTLTKGTCSDCGTHSISGADITMSHEALSEDNNFTHLTHTFTVTRSSGNELYYIKNDVNMDDCIVRSDVIKKIINRSEDIFDSSPIRTFPIKDKATAIGTESPGFTPSYSGDVKVGMKFKGTIQKTKTIMKIIELDENGEVCVNYSKTKPVKTNKFEVENTNDLFVGMNVEINNFRTHLTSVDCEKGITLADEGILHLGDTLTFTYESHGRVIQVGAMSSDGVVITLNREVQFPRGTELSFTNSKEAVLEGIMSVDQEGGNTMTITTKISSAIFGQEDVTFTIEPDLFITTKPPAQDMYITVRRNSGENYINIINRYFNINDGSKTVSIVSGPTSGVVADKGRGAGYRTYEPNANFTGRDKVKYTISDGVTTSDEKTIYITVK